MQRSQKVGRVSLRTSSANELGRSLSGVIKGQFLIVLKTEEESEDTLPSIDF